MNRYLVACNGDKRRAMTLYRKNLKLSQELFTLISCFEVALRNAIDSYYNSHLGNDWLRNAVAPGGIFDNSDCSNSARAIQEEITRLNTRYSHSKLVAGLGLGFWRYMFSRNQYRAGGQQLLSIFPSRPHSSPSIQYNRAYVEGELKKINDLRNRIAHHEPICFVSGMPIKDTTYARLHYGIILQLFQWMQIDEASFLYGLDHINSTCDNIDGL